MPKRTLLLLTLWSLTACLALAQTTPPPPPTHLKAVLDQMMMGPMPVVRLTWEAPSGRWGFKISRSVGDSLHFQVLAGTTNRVFYDRTVEMGKKYYYLVRTVVVTPDSHVVESEPSNLAWIDLATLPPVRKGVIAGVVKDDTTGKPIPRIPVRFFRQGSGIYPAVVPTVFTDSLGHYTALLDTGTYLVKADPPPFMPPGQPGYVPEWFDNVREMSKATPVRVDSGKAFGADFGLSRVYPPAVPKGVITGTVVDDSTRKPIRGIPIGFYPLFNTVYRELLPPRAVTDSLGRYSAVLDTGRYIVRAGGVPPTSVSDGYQLEWFDNAREVKDATPVPVGDKTVSVADFALSRIPPPLAVTIEGSVKDTTGLPLRGALVVVMRSLQEMVHLSTWNSGDPWLAQEAMEVQGVGYCGGVLWRGYSDSSGNFTGKVPEGARVIVMASKPGYLPEYYKEKATPLSADVILADKNLTGIDFTLAINPLLNNSISGVVRDSLGTGVPSRIVLFPLLPARTAYAGVGFGHTDSNGVYTVAGVRAGKYFVLAVPFRGYAPAFYKDGAFGVKCWQEADTVVIGGHVTGIDIGVVPFVARGTMMLTGRVLDAEGTPLEGVRVFASSSGGDLLGIAVTDAAGLFAIEGLASGPLNLVVDRDGFLSAEQSLLPPADVYSFSAGDIILRSTTTDVPASPGEPLSYRLNQNFPNPFNPGTTIGFSLPNRGPVSLRIYDVLGREVTRLVDEVRDAGYHEVIWRAEQLPSGTYFCRMVAGPFTETRRLMLLK